MLSVIPFLLAEEEPLAPIALLVKALLTLTFDAAVCEAEAVEALLVPVVITFPVPLIFEKLLPRLLIVAGLPVGAAWTAMQRAAITVSRVYTCMTDPWSGR